MFTFDLANYYISPLYVLPPFFLLVVLLLTYQHHRQRNQHRQNIALAESKRDQDIRDLMLKTFGTTLEDLRRDPPSRLPAGSLFPLLDPPDWFAIKLHVNELIDLGIEPEDLELVLSYHTWSLIHARSSLLEASIRMEASLPN